MIEILVIIMCALTIILLKISLGVKFKDLARLKSRKNEDLETLSKKFKSDEEICREILKIKENENENVKIKQESDYESCLYTVFNNTITIGKFNQNYMKLQTIAHECIHACQNKLTLWFNFIFSNIYLLYFFTISILTIFNITYNNEIYLIILIFMSFIQYIIRLSLENDAMQNAKNLAKEYLEKNKILEKKEEEILLKEYNQINKIAIPATNFELIFKNLIKIIIYSIIILI